MMTVLLRKFPIIYHCAKNHPSERPENDNIKKDFKPIEKKPYLKFDTSALNNT